MATVFSSRPDQGLGFSLPCEDHPSPTARLSGFQPDDRDRQRAKGERAHLRSETYFLSCHGVRSRSVLTPCIKQAHPTIPITPYRTVPSHIIPFPYRTIPEHTITYQTVPYHTSPRRTTPYHAVPHRTVRPGPRPPLPKQLSSISPPFATRPTSFRTLPSSPNVQRSECLLPSLASHCTSCLR